jgi:hypothetical protein
MRRLRTVGAVTAALALLAGGCGGGGGRLSKSQYEQHLHDAGHELDVAIPKVWNAKTTSALKDAVEAVQRAFDAAADDLDVTPPQDVENANGRVVRGFHELADEFGQVSDAADKGVDAGKKKAQDIAAGRTSRNTELAIKEISRRGYDTGSLGG